MNVISLKVTVDENDSWWVEFIRASNIDISAAMDSNQVKWTQHMVSDKLLMRSTVKGSVNYGGDDMRQLYNAVQNVLNTRLP